MRPIQPQRSHHGQTIVEFALIAPFFLALLFGVLDVGRAIITYNVVSNAAREGARYAAIHQLDSSGNCSTASGAQVTAIQTAALATTGPFANNITVSVATACGQDPANTLFYPTHYYKIRASYTFQPYTAAVIGLGPYNLVASAKVYQYSPN
jgi:Flp pilus assembly protein TadG